MKTRKTVYPIVLTPDPSGGYVVRVPGLDINTEGDTVPECIDMAREAIGLWGICEEDSGRAVPAPASLSPEHEPNEIVTLVDVDFDFFRRAQESRTVRKNLTIPSWLNSFGEQRHLNFSQVLTDALTDIYRQSV